MPAVPEADPAAGPVATPGLSSPADRRLIAGVAAGPGRLIGAGVGFFFVSFSFDGKSTAFSDGGSGFSSGGFSILGFSDAGGAGGTWAGPGRTSGAVGDPARIRRTATARGA